MSKFIIFAIARSGSTSLARLLGRSEDVEMAIEPFHESWAEWHPDEPDYRNMVRDKFSLDEVHKDLFSRYTAIKVLNYQLDTDLYKHLLSKRDLKILFLYRKNVIESIISAEIAEQTSVWHRDELNAETKKNFANLKPLDINILKEKYFYITKQYQEFVDFLERKRPNDHLKLYYEDLYSKNMDKNLRTLKEVCEFLNVKLPSREYIDQYMTISKAKINQRDMYKSLPNYDEIEQAFRLNN